MDFRSLATTSRLVTAGIAALVGCGLAMLALHLVPDRNPLFDVISSYVFTERGWLLPVALLSLAIGSAAFAWVLHRIGSPRPIPALMGFWSVCITAVAVFPTDPAGTEGISAVAQVHRISAFLAFAAMATLGLLVGFRYRHHPVWESVAGRIRPMALLSTAALFTIVVPYVITILNGDSHVPPEFPVGLTQRMTVGAELLLLAVLADWLRTMVAPVAAAPTTVPSADAPAAAVRPATTPAIGATIVRRPLSTTGPAIGRGSRAALATATDGAAYSSSWTRSA